MNPDPSLTALGLPLFGKENDTYETVVERIQTEVSQLDAAELDEFMNEKYKQAGTIAWTSEEYFVSEHGQQSGRIGLYELSKNRLTAGKLVADERQLLSISEETTSGP